MVRGRGAPRRAWAGGPPAAWLLAALVLLAGLAGGVQGARGTRGGAAGGDGGSLGLPRLELGGRGSSADGAALGFVDPARRAVLLRGVNAVVKGPPWVPVSGEFSRDLSMTDRDFEIMQSLGLNLLRLGVMWPGVEPKRGEYNETYLDLVEDITHRAANYGVYTLLDMHQDVLSEEFCGEGIPRWAVRTQSKGRHAFPAPLLSPFTEKDENGFPTRQDCAKLSWPHFYATHAAGEAFEALWKNHDGLTQSWAEMWAHVAERFRGQSQVVGLELMNEPFPGDVFRHPTELIPGGIFSGDRRNMQPAYDRIAAAVARVDPTRLIFFAGMTWDDFGPGFKHPPGGSERAGHSVLAYHYYSPPQLRADTPEKAKVHLRMNMRAAQKLGTAAFLTETCDPICTSVSPDGPFENVAAAADAFFQSYASWEWKPFCRESDASLKSASRWAEYGACITGYGPAWSNDNGPPGLPRYARTFPHAIAGTPISMSYSPEAADRRFELKYKMDIHIPEPTAIFASPHNYPPGRLSVEVDPAAAASVELAEPFVLVRPRAGLLQGQHVTVTVKAS